jgi:hypothetical protein
MLALILKAATFVWLGISVVTSACVIFSAPNIQLFPLTVGVRELSPWLAVGGGQPVVLLEIPWAEHAFDAVFSGPGNQLALFYIECFLDATLRDRM